MAKTPKRTSSGRLAPRQIVGFSLEPDLAREVKAVAAKRGLSLKELFGEMWAAYQKKDSGAKS